MGGKTRALRCASMHYTHLSDKHPASFTMILCCMRSLDPWFACILFFFFTFLFYDSLWSFVSLFGFFMPIFVLFVCSLSLVGCTSCVCVLSLPVQCWSLSYGKQRRPFRLCAPTWLRQQVWRTFNFFSTSTLFFFLLQLSLLLFLREFL